ncbi:MAG: glycosyltransferase family 4 protein [Cyclobacteriaceae bacterium]
MHIIYLHQYFKLPGEPGGHRSWYFANAMAAQDWQVDVVTAHNIKKAATREVDGIRIHYLPVSYDNSFSTVRRVYSFVKFAVLALLKIRKLKKSNLLYATSTPLSIGMVALFSKKLFGIPYIFEVRDLWPDVPAQMGYIRSKWLYRLLKHLEKMIYRNSEQVIALSPAISDHISAENPDLKIQMLPNMADCDFFAKENTKNSRLEGIPTDRKLISYTGTLGRANHLEYLLQAAHMAKKELPELFFVIAGDGARKHALMELAKDLALDNIIFTGALSKEKVRQLLQGSLAAYISYASYPMLHTGSPNKFFDALAAGCPVIINFGGWISDLVLLKQLGFYADPDRPKELMEAIRKNLYNKEIWQSFSVNASNCAGDTFSKKKICNDLTMILKNKV